MTEFLDERITVFKIKLKRMDLLFLFAILCLGIAARFALFDFESGDYYHFLSHWMEECHNAGGFAYLSIVPGDSNLSTINYGCMYQYIIVILHYLGRFASDMHLIKWVSVIFDVLCAICVLRITTEITKGDITKSFISFAIVMFLPTSVLNSGAWAQCDSIYAAFVLLSFLHLLKGDGKRLFIYFAIAYTFKQQTIFMLPFMIIMWLKGRIRIRDAVWFPLVVFLTMIPAMIAGRSPVELLGIYFEQVGQYTSLTMNYPSIYTVVSTDLALETRRMIISAGTIMTVVIMGVICYYVLSRKFEVTDEFMITLAIFTAETALFVLPVMHERYGYVPEMLAAVYAVLGFRRLAVSSLLWLVPVITYSRFLFGSTVKSLWPLSACMFLVILMIGYDLSRQMNKIEVKKSGK